MGQLEDKKIQKGRKRNEDEHRLHTEVEEESRLTILTISKQIGTDCPQLTVNCESMTPAVLRGHTNSKCCQHLRNNYLLHARHGMGASTRLRKSGISPRDFF